MRRITKYRYEVKPDEVVTMTFSAIGVGEAFIAAALDGNELIAVPESPPTYKFRVKKPKGDAHFCRLECTFLEDTPSTARFESTIHGSFGGDFAGPIIMKGDAVLDPDITFEVA
ncbi:MAG TPA: hypothetical protein VNI02_15695 [Blastocatellia bacterium]|nr:hypothetical protein [Blastocatellia bacterium]